MRACMQLCRHGKYLIQNLFRIKSVTCMHTSLTHLFVCLLVDRHQAKIRDLEESKRLAVMQTSEEKKLEVEVRLVDCCEHKRVLLFHVESSIETVCMYVCMQTLKAQHRQEIEEMRHMHKLQQAAKQAEFDQALTAQQRLREAVCA
jgi:hypothetical protein